MLRQRIITALVLVALLLGALVSASAWPFAMLTLALIAAGGWEWGRLNQAQGWQSLVMGGAVAAAGLAVLAAGWVVPSALWWAALALWLAAGTVALRSGPQAWPHLPRAARWAIGLVALWATWLAVTQARAIGANFLLSTLCLVWMADIAAYFGGRAWGRRKLAPAISPGKSWEGVWSGMLGVLLLAAFWSVVVDRQLRVDSHSLYGQLTQRLGIFGAILALLLLSTMSVVGDLFESLVKRSAGAKDSSGLLPGHGGVLDRIDALLPVVPLALALTSL